MEHGILRGFWKPSGAGQLEKAKAIVFLKLCLFFTSFLGFFLVLTEVFLNNRGASLCTSQSCVLVHGFDAYGVLNWMGLLLSAFLLLTSLLDLVGLCGERALNCLLKLRTLAVSSAVLAEGYLTGIQTWYLGRFCHYCLVFAGLLLLFAVFDFTYQRKRDDFALTYLKALAGALVIFALTSIVKVPLTSIPDAGLPVIVYEKGCSHCRSVMNYASVNGVKFLKVPAKDVMPLFYVLRLKGVPVLIHKTKTSYEVVSGEEEIKKWLRVNSARKNRSSFLLIPEQEEPGVCSLSGEGCGK